MNLYIKERWGHLIKQLFFNGKITLKHFQWLNDGLAWNIQKRNKIEKKTQIYQFRYKVYWTYRQRALFRKIVFVFQPFVFFPLWPCFFTTTMNILLNNIFVHVSEHNPNLYIGKKLPYDIYSTQYKPFIKVGNSQFSMKYRKINGFYGKQYAARR